MVVDRDGTKCTRGLDILLTNPCRIASEQKQAGMKNEEGERIMRNNYFFKLQQYEYRCRTSNRITRKDEDYFFKIAEQLIWCFFSGILVRAWCGILPQTVKVLAVKNINFIKTS